MFKLKTLKCIGFKRLHIPKEIDFPDGRMLIYGRNESGKSTIMEAIHYGLYGLALRPSKRASNDDLINYGLPEALIELTFTIDDNEYSVKRVLKKKSANSHELTILRSDGKRERVSGARTVNRLLLEELHGIDSDALLNSCLVEQKELGKLEDAVRAKRIEAMTSLLNIEAFVEAQQDIKKGTRALEQKNRETFYKMEQAEQAKNDFEEAEKKLAEAQSRITQVFTKLEEIRKKITELDEILKVIDRVKEINGVIENRTVQTAGLKRELKRIEQSLKEAEEAVNIVNTIMVELPEAQLRFEDVEKRYRAIESLVGLTSQIELSNGEVKRAKERLEEAEKKVQEAEQASEQVEKLDERISLLEPARTAQSLFTQLQSSTGDFITAKREIGRLEKDESEFVSKLVSLEDAEKQIEELHEQEEQLISSKNTASRRRNIGFIIILLGVLSALGQSISPYLMPFGAAIIILGTIIVIKSSTSGYDSQLSTLREKRDSLLGDKMRIEDYEQGLEDTQQKLGENKEILKTAKAELDSTIIKLPGTPRDYQALIYKDVDLQNSISSLRETIQNDIHSLVKITTERDGKQEISDEIEQRKSDRDNMDALHKADLEKVETLEIQFKEVEEMHGVKVDQADSIKAERDEVQKKVQELETNLDTYQNKASQKEELEQEIKEKEEVVQGFETEIKELDEEKIKLVSDYDVDLSREGVLREQNEELKKNSARLETEKLEREADVEEAKVTMDENLELKDEYPKLVDLNEEEKFDLEAMKKAVTLLDTTRDGIMGGVKKRIESHMVQFLPALTDERYNMARIDENEYRIEIYDREAKRWRGKGVFSGATQDQFSLALRLAFALSTIPSTRGARPGFIFLDEPLSGFDAQRRKGFMNLLQEELPRYFDQIIVISHLEALQEEFLHNLQLEAGEIIGRI